MEQVRHTVDAQGGQCRMQQSFRERLCGRVTLDNGADVLGEKADQIHRCESFWRLGFPGRILSPAFSHEADGAYGARL